MLSRRGPKARHSDPFRAAFRIMLGIVIDCLWVAHNWADQEGRSLPRQPRLRHSSRDAGSGMAKTALITGISGQDGAYLAKSLLDRGYRVVGAQRRNAGINSGRLEELGILADVELADMELLEESNIRAVLRKLQPDEIYNLAAQSFVGFSFEQPLYTCDVERARGVALARMHEGGLPRGALLSGVDVRDVRQGAGGAAKRDHALSSAQPLWRGQAVCPLDHGELPRSATASSPAPASCSITNRHLRGASSLPARSRSGSRGWRWAAGRPQLGNLEAKRDWGFAGEYVEGMWMMLQQEQPDDYVLATGRTHSVRDFVNAARRSSWVRSRLERRRRECPRHR